MTSRVLLAIPAFNEARHLERVVTAVRAHMREILVVDDGSTDGTPQLLARLGIPTVRHPANRGYGGAMQTIFRHAEEGGHGWVLVMDCDEQHEPALIPDFLAAIEEEDADVISGSRYLAQHSQDTDAPPDRRLINATLTREIRQRLGLPITDAFCGFKAYRVASLARLRLDADGYEFPMQFWAEAAATGLRIREIAVPRIYLDPNRSFGPTLDDPAVRLSHYRKTLEGAIARALPCRSRVAAPAPRALAGPPWLVDAARASRGELGLPQATLMATGHQAGFWHAGVLAKFMYLRRAAAHADAAMLWFLADHDARDPARIELPGMDAAGNWRRRVLHLLPAAEGICDLHNPATEPVWRANAELARRWIGSAPVVRVSRLMQTSLGRALLEAMRKAPDACIDAHDAGCDAHPGIVRRLRPRRGTARLPLWGMDGAGRRQPVRPDELGAALDAGSPLLPDAIIASGLMRMVTDAFVHGTGGERYEAVGDGFWSRWLGVTLPPFHVATATLQLGARGTAPPPPDRSVREAIFDPPSAAAPVGAARPSGPMRELLAEVARHPRRTRERQHSYRRLVEERERLRTRHEPDIDALREAWDRHAADAASAAVLEDRTVPWILLDPAQLDALERELARRLGEDLPGGPSRGASVQPA